MARGHGEPPRWLTVCRHRIPRYGTPFLVVLQHHFVTSLTRIVAPVVPLRGPTATVLAPRVMIQTTPYRAILLEMASASLERLGAPVEDAEINQDEVHAALDAIFRGYPVGLPLA